MDQRRPPGRHPPAGPRRRDHRRVARCEGKDIGTIEITDGFSIVEVPEAAADHVVRALKGTKIKGKKAKIRRDKMV